MKKLQLEMLAIGHTETLTRDQLKNILGGKAAPNVQCGFYGSSGCAAGDDMPENCGDLDSCQDAADALCAKYDCCDDAACKYA